MKRKDNEKIQLKNIFPDSLNAGICFCSFSQAYVNS